MERRRSQAVTAGGHMEGKKKIISTAIAVLLFTGGIALAQAGGGGGAGSGSAGGGSAGSAGSAGSTGTAPGVHLALPVAPVRRLAIPARLRLLPARRPLRQPILRPSAARRGSTLRTRRT